MTIQEILMEGKRLLQSPCDSAFIDTPALDAALLLAEVLGTNHEGLITNGNETVSGRDRGEYLNLLERRRSGECVAYILGRREFRGLVFNVNPKVLVPRPDTETLFEAALEYIADFCREGLCNGKVDDNGGLGLSGLGLSVLDLCTGSGVLAVSLKNEMPFLPVTASDISVDSLETAALNAARLLAGEAPVNFIHSDLFKNITGRFNMIISNPPYVPSGELESLAPEVRREPHLALDGGGDGLDLIRKIIAGAPGKLLPGGALLIEAGPGQMPQIKALMANNGFTGVALHRDLGGRDRVISAKLH